MEEEEKVILTVDTGGSVETIKNLRLSLRQARSAMLEAETGSEDYSKALKVAADAQSRLNDISSDTRAAAADYTRVISQSTRALGGMVGGIGAVNGVMALMGTESEALNETFVKLQAGMAITQGLNGFAGMISGVSDLTKTFKANAIGTKALTVVQRIYNAVLNANPIFLLVTVIAAVVAGIYLLTKALGKQKDEQIDLNKHTEDYMKMRENLTDSYSFEIRMMEANGKTATEIHNRKMEQNAQLSRDSMSRINELSAMQEGASKKRRKEIQEEIDKERELYGKAIDDRKKLEEDFTVHKAREATKQAADQAKANADAYLKEVEHQAKLKDLKEKEAAEIKKILDDIYLDSLDSQEKSLELLDREYRERYSKLKGNKDDLIELQKWYSIQRADILHKETLTVVAGSKGEAEELVRITKEKYDALYMEMQNAGKSEMELILERQAEEMLLLMQNNEDTANLEILHAQEVADAQVRITKEAEEKRRDEIEKTIQLNLKSFDEIMNAGAHFAGAMGSMNDARLARELAGAQGNEEAQEAIKKKAFEQNKKLEIANSLMAGLKGIVNAMSAPTVLPEPFGMALRVANAAAIGISTGANVTKIKATKYDGGGGGSTSTPSSPSSMPSMPRTPAAPSIDSSVNFVRNVTTEEEDLQAQRPIKAYVVESEISSVQKRVSNAQNEASF